jgi:signal transduction histidine kinase
MLVPAAVREAHRSQRAAYFTAPSPRAMGNGRDVFGLRKDAREIPLEVGLRPLATSQGEFVLAALLDVSPRRRAEELRRLGAEFGQHALAAPRVGGLKQEAADLIARVLNVPLVAIGSLTPDDRSIIVEAGVGWPRARLGSLAIDVTDNSQAAHSVRTGQPAFIEQIDVDYPYDYSDAMRDHQVLCSATVPIRGRDSTVGLIIVDDVERRAFSADDAVFLTGVATIIGMVIDRDRNEDRIAHLTAELQQRYDELESFSYSVAHDLRAPLRSVAGFAAALREDFGESLDETATRYLGLIIGAAGQMGSLIDALLSLARVSRQEISRSSVDLSGMARSIVDELRSAEPDRAASVGIEPNLQVDGDTHLLRIVLYNLLGNAWKFTRGRDPAHIAFGGSTNGEETTFWVEDNGVGFATSYPQELFTPFRRLHGSSFEGLGIGLATVARIVRRHGGRVWAESEPGSGAKFYCAFGRSKN